MDHPLRSDTQKVLRGRVVQLLKSGFNIIKDSNIVFVAAETVLKKNAVSLKQFSRIYFQSMSFSNQNLRWKTISPMRMTTPSILQISRPWSQISPLQLFFSQRHPAHLRSWVIFRANRSWRPRRYLSSTQTIKNLVASYLLGQQAKLRKSQFLRCPC